MPATFKSPVIFQITCYFSYT